MFETNIKEFLSQNDIKMYYIDKFINNSHISQLLRETNFKCEEFFANESLRYYKNKYFSTENIDNFKIVSLSTTNPSYDIKLIIAYRDSEITNLYLYFYVGVIDNN